ncbi:hypothetical protein H5410_029348 [Solanum commersonii]|uniref:Uncharacterized protein n=1 Tax=Solanum commersonii TaxID=4109 RepID=A0A9J5Z7D5_SOLCO|nr:hypothetical protein H5410_029348 [Solanum commersonii]
MINCGTHEQCFLNIVHMLISSSSFSVVFPFLIDDFQVLPFRSLIFRKLVYPKVFKKLPRSYFTKYSWANNTRKIEEFL